jgi:hypothetical protein
MATSALANLTVTNSGGQPIGTNAPGFAQQPANVLAIEGTNVVFSVNATGAPPITYQWYFFSNAISAATQSVFILTNVQGSNAGFYQAVASNTFGTATSIFASLTVTNTNGMIFLPGGTNGIPLSNSPPIITQEPTNQNATASNTVIIVVGANGAMPLFYQWRYRTNPAAPPTDISPATNPSATNASLTFSNAAVTNTGFYDVVVTNSFGSATSAIARLLVTPPLPCPTCDLKSGSFAAENLWIESIIAHAEGVTIQVSGGGNYTKLVLEYKEQLGDAEWKVLSTHDATELKLVDPKPPMDRSRYYRVRAE